MIVNHARPNFQITYRRMQYLNSSVAPGLPIDGTKWPHFFWHSKSIIQALRKLVALYRENPTCLVLVSQAASRVRWKGLILVCWIEGFDSLSIAGHKPNAVSLTRPAYLEQESVSLINNLLALLLNQSYGDVPRIKPKKYTFSN
jgi:hypothetical protein